MQISLFVPCLVDQVFPETAVATVKLLQKLGHEIHYDKRQTCCGQPLYNTGFRKEARDLAIRFVKIFREQEIIVAPSASCVAMVKKHYGELDLPAPVYNDWETLKDRIWELSSFLVDYLDTEILGAKFTGSVLYHPSCHALRELKIDAQPRKLLNSVEGISVVEAAVDPECCGFGGAFSVKYPELAYDIAERRALAYDQCGAEVVTGVDDSCLNHLSRAFKRIDSKVKTIHLSRILASGGSAR